MNFGFGELIDRMEKHIGSFFTKVLVFSAWLTAMAFCVKSVFDYIIGPIIKAGPDIHTALGWADAIRVGTTIFIAACAASYVMDAYRIRNLRGQYEETTGRSADLVNEIEAKAEVFRAEREEMMSDVRRMIDEVTETNKHVLDLKTSAVLMAEKMYKHAERGEPIPADRLAIFRELLDVAQAEWKSVVERKSKAQGEPDGQAE